METFLHNGSSRVVSTGSSLNIDEHHRSHDRTGSCNTAPGGAGAAAPGVPWARVALACAVLVASGGARWWRARRIDAVLEQGKQSPFPLKDLPLTLGDWRGEPAAPDPEIVRTTGATDFTFRRFVNQSTGVALEVYVLYGPAVDLFLHAPENCYPAAGFALKQAAAERTVEAGPLRAPFRTLVYGRGEGAQTDLQEVYYSWRFQGRWSPDYGKFKQLERIPGMFKVQLARRIVGQGAATSETPARPSCKCCSPRSSAA